MLSTTEKHKALLKKYGLDAPIKRGYVRLDIESKLDYKVDPKRNYREEIDKAVPAWREAPYETLPGSSATFHDPSDPRGGKPNLMYDPTTGYEWAMPHYKYVRALHPNGNIQCLIVSTCRPGPTSPGGDDQQGSEERIIGQKRREKGWLLLEDGAEYNGRSGNEYLAWCMAVADWRRANYELNEEADRVEHQNKAEVLQRQLLEQQTEITGKMMSGVADIVTRAVLEAQGKPAKVRPEAGA